MRWLYPPPSKGDEEGKVEKDLEKEDVCAKLSRAATSQGSRSHEGHGKPSAGGLNGFAQ